MAADSKYSYLFCEIARGMTLLGATDVELARHFGVTTKTINQWKKLHPAFLRSITEGKEKADGRVADSLFNRALGYSHKAVKIFYDSKTGKTVEHEYTQHYPPETVACIFWLKNRQSKLWRDRVENVVSGDADRLDEVLAVLRHAEKNQAAEE